MAFDTKRASARSPAITCTAPAWRTLSACAACLVSAFTFAPRAASARITARPVSPAAPVTRIVGWRAIGLRIQDLFDQSRAAEDQPGIDLHQTCAGVYC